MTGSLGTDVSYQTHRQKTGSRTLKGCVPVDKLSNAGNNDMGDRVTRQFAFLCRWQEQRSEPDMLDEYDFISGIPGKYAKRYADGCNVVILDPDVAKIFPDSESANDSLRALAEIIRRREKRGA